MQKGWVWEESFTRWEDKGSLRPSDLVEQVVEEVEVEAILHHLSPNPHVSHRQLPPRQCSGKAHVREKPWQFQKVELG